MTFGPSFLMDKSTFQGLSFECVVMLMRYYRQPISPILLRELTSDLAKEVRGDDDQEMKKKVAQLAAKMHYSHSFVLPDSLKMACNELLYDNFIPMNGYQAPCERMMEVSTPKMGRGYFIDEHPMLATLRNWADGNFPAEDLCRAKAIRDEDSALDLVSLYRQIEQETEQEAKVPKFRSIEEMVEYADTILLLNMTPRREVLRAARYFFQNRIEHVETVMRRWAQKGRPALRDFAPYAMYVYRVDIVYHYCLLRGFVKCSKKGKAHLDMQYFYYLPFCQIFSSDDKEIMKLVPFFQRPDQRFITKTDLQNDLKNLSAYFVGLSEEDSKNFYEEYGPYPPDLDNSFTTQVWKQFMRPKQKHEGKRSQPSPEKEAEIMEQFREIREAVEKQQTQNKQKA
jgi:hypothetical protein